MKKLSIMILLLISISIAFIGCGKNEENQCKDVVKNFAVEMYNQSCDELVKFHPTEYSFDVFKEYFTDEGLANFENDKTLSKYYDYIIDNKMNMVLWS